ncbi:MAG TPA: rod shape-determining protein [Tepiditoga sp.]|nr:rod shape-determining protein [Tepiditoga sp.]
MAKHDLGIDLGTATFVVYKKGEGIILEEPSVVAVNKKKNKIIAIGQEAKEMLGKTPGEIEIIRPVQDGVINAPDIIEEVLRYFVKNAKTGISFSKPTLVIGIPALTTDVERRAVKEAAEKVGASEVFLVVEPVAAAIGSEIDITKPNGNMVVDIGGGTTDIAVISLGGTVLSESIKVAGQAMDSEIIKYIKKKFRFSVGEATAEMLKKEIGKVHPAEEEKEMMIKGQNIKTGLPDQLKMTSTDVQKAVEPVISEIISKVKIVLEKTPPELAADIMNNGIILAGGAAKIRGFEKILTEKTGVETKILETPDLTVAKGTGILLDNRELLIRVAVE